MKKIAFGSLIASLAALSLTLSASAAGIALTNGGFGQTAANPSQFGIAVCNTGSKPLSQSVPVSLTVGSVSVSIFSANSIKAGGCEYSYTAYSNLNMEAGKSYAVNVVIDPGHSVIGNANNGTVYNITVPGTPSTVNSGASNNQTADVSSPANNLFANVWGWLVSLFTGK